MTNLKVTLACDRATDNTIVFKEVLDGENMLATRKIGTIYVPKNTLADMGWKGERLTFAISPAPEAK